MGGRLYSWVSKHTPLPDTDWSLNDTLKNAFGYGNGKQQPGVGGPAPDPSRLVRDPMTGKYVDPATGTTYTDATGQTPVAAPNVSQQVALNSQTSRDFLGRLQQSDAEHRQAFEGQTGLINQLDNTINNRNAPSVAATQLAINNDNNARQAMGTAAGVQGPNAFAARRAALQAVAQGNTGTAQNAALLRAHEVATAQQQKGNVLGQQSALGNQRYGQDMTGAGEFAVLADRGQEGVQGLNAKQDLEDQKNTSTWGGKLFDFGTAGIGGSMFGKK